MCVGLVVAGVVVVVVVVGEPHVLQKWKCSAMMICVCTCMCEVH